MMVLANVSQKREELPAALISFSSFGYRNMALVMIVFFSVITFTLTFLL